MQNLKIFFYLFFAAIIAIVGTIVGSIIMLIKNFFVNHYRELIFSVVVLSAIIPLIISSQTDWRIPDLLVLWVFIVFSIGFFMVISWAGRDDFDEYRQSGRNYNSGSYSKTHTSVHTNTYYSPDAIEKRKNGGITDKEVLERKKLIRRKLEKKKLVETKEEEIISK